jgi:hypothetical protein
MKVVIDDSQLQKLIKETSIAERGAVIFARKVVKASSFALEKRVKLEMPVDFGVARASWGHWKGNIRSGHRTIEGGPIWKEEDGGLAIEQGTSVEYVTYLNRGHSSQAPAGFIDRAFVVAEFEMMRTLGAFDPLDPKGVGVQLPLFGE